jgi:hypothetical protein
MNQAEIEKRLEEFREIGKAGFFGGRRGRPAEDSAYSSRAQAALAQINRPDYPAGMIPWLGEAHPDLYDELTSRIPDEIDLAWKCQAPLAEFEAILARLVQTHRQACELYRAQQAAQTEPTTTTKTSLHDFGTPTDDGDAR